MTNRPPPCGNYGDIDGNGQVTMDDSLYVANHVVGKSGYPMTCEQKRRADVNGDGELTMSDAMLIGKYAEGTIDTFPVCSKPEENRIPWLLIGAAIILLYLLTRG